MRRPPHHYHRHEGKSEANHFRPLCTAPLPSSLKCIREAVKKIDFLGIFPT